MLRENAGFSQAQFASEILISRSYLSLIEKDKREATMPLLRRMAQVLGMPATILFAASLGSSLTKDGHGEEAVVIAKLIEAVRLSLTQARLPIVFQPTVEV